jgi:hypothetical protein
MSYNGGKNIAMKVPPHQWAETVNFYESTLGLDVVSRSEESVSFVFGANRLWVDRVGSLSQAEIWLEVITDDLAAAERLAGKPGVSRRDEIEPLPAGFRGYWLSNPASIIHLVTAGD